MIYKLLVKSNPTSPAQEEAYNKWYSDEHLAQILDLPGVIAAERFKLGDTQLRGSPAPTHQYLAIYTIDTDDIMVLITAMRERMGTPQLIVSETIDTPNVSTEIFVQLP